MPEKRSCARLWSLCLVGSNVLSLATTHKAINSVFGLAMRHFTVCWAFVGGSFHKGLPQSVITPPESNRKRGFGNNLFKLLVDLVIDKGEIEPV